jgi:polygalacturonase
VLNTPFPMKAVRIPNFAGTARLLITDYGARPGDQVKTTAAIAKAIDQAHQMAGGTVVIPPGEWITGQIHLKSNVNLYLAKNATLLFSGKPEDYLPAVETTWEGMECFNYSPLIYAFNCKNIAITGEGELKAKMDVWKEWFKRPSGHMQSIKRLYNLASAYSPVKDRQMVNDTARLRPQFIQFNRCEQVLIEGIRITNSPFWTIHPYRSKNVTIRNISICAQGHNNDGVDPEMSQNVLIENCIFDQGDDAIAIKSGRNPEGWKLKLPSKNIVIRNCTVKNGHQLLAIGTELSGGIENVLIENCEVLEGAKLNHLIFIKTNQRMGGFVRNIYARNIRAGKIDSGILGIETDVLYQWKTLVPTVEVRLTPISGVFLDRILAKQVTFLSRILGENTLPVKNIRLNRVSAQIITGQAHIHENVTGFKAR